MSPSPIASNSSIYDNLTWPPRRSLSSLGSFRQDRTWWQAARHILWDQWEPAPGDERPWRWLSAILSVLANLFFALMMIYLMYVQYMALRSPEEQQESVFVEFIGRGNVTEGGGDLQPSEVASSSASNASAAAASAPTASTSSQPAPSTSSDASSAVVTPVDPPRPTPTPQSTDVTLSKEVPDTSTFQLPDTQIKMPAMTAPTVSAPTRSPALRDIQDPLRQPNVRLAVPTGPALPSIVAPQRGLQERSIPTPVARSGGSTGKAATAASSAAANRANPSASSGVATMASRPSGAGTSTSTGPRTAPTSGGWYQDRGTSDLGNSTRNRDGSAQGSRQASNGGALKGNDLFDEQGKPKLPYKGSASRNDPPGLVNGEVRDLDRVGTWRKRRPTDGGLPGSNMVWMPNESMLEEWVRRSVREVSIRIPGTTTTVKCKVALLALGGGCGIRDPNKADQEAIARPPPPVPYKSELNQHNGGRREDQKVEDFGPGAILPGQEIKKQGPNALPPPPSSARPQFKFGDD